MSFLKRFFGSGPSTPRDPELVINFPLHVPVENRIAYDEAEFADLLIGGERPLSLALEVNRIRSFVAECLTGRGPGLREISQSFEVPQRYMLFTRMEIDCGKCGQNYMTSEVTPALVDEASLPACSNCGSTTAVLLFDEISAADILPSDADAVLSYLRSIAEGCWSSGAVSKVTCFTCEKTIPPGTGFNYGPCGEEMRMACAECGEKLRSELADNPLKFGERQLRLARHYFGDPQATSTLHMSVAEYVRGLGVRCTNTDLYDASRDGNANAVGLLLQRGADVNAKTGPDGATALCTASGNGHLDIVKVLLKHGADVNAHDVSLRAPLHMAASNGYAEIVKLLMANGAYANAMSDGNLTALHIAASNGYVQIVKLLAAKGADVNAGRVTPLHLAASNGHVEVCQLLMARGADVSASIDEHGMQTASRIAAKNGHVELYQLLRTPKDCEQERKLLEGLSRDRKTSR